MSKFEFKGVAVAKDGGFDQSDVRIRITSGFHGYYRDIELESLTVRPQSYSELRPTYKALSRCVLAVAAPGWTGNDWAVYIGAVPGKSHEEEVELVKRDGAKQGREIATFLFPQFDPEKYRD